MKLVLQFTDSFNVELCKYLKSVKLFEKQKRQYFKQFEEQKYIQIVRYIEKTLFNVLKVDRRGNGAPKSGNTISSFEVSNEKKPGIHSFSVDVGAFIDAIKDRVSGVLTLEFIWDEHKANMKVTLKSCDSKYEQMLPMELEDDPVAQCLPAQDKLLTFKNAEAGPLHNAAEKLVKFLGEDGARVCLSVQLPCIDVEQDLTETPKLQQKGPEQHLGIIHVTFTVNAVKLHESVLHNIRQAIVQKHCKNLQQKVEYEAARKNTTPQLVAEALDLPWNCLRAEIDETDAILQHKLVLESRIKHTYILNCLVPGKNLLSLLSCREDKCENALIINPAALTFTSKTHSGCKFKTIIQVTEITNDIHIKE